MSTMNPNPRILTRNEIVSGEQFSEEDIIETIINGWVKLETIVKYQNVSAYICAKYIIYGGVNEEYGMSGEDRYVSKDECLRYQPHLTEDEIDYWIDKLRKESPPPVCKKRIYE